MALGAMCFGGILGTPANSPQDIHASSYRLKVVGPNAGRVSTEVVNLQSFWDRPNEMLVRRPMCRDLLAAPNMKQSVALARHSGAGPSPTTDC